MTTLSIAAMQTAPIARDPEATLEVLADRTPAVKAAVPHAQLLIVPELHLSAVPGLLDESDGYAESVAVELPGPLTDRLGEIARDSGLWLVAGSVYERSGGAAIHNTALAISPEGELAARYRKVFPWRPMEHSTPGDGFVTFDIPEVGRVGLAICYDGFFPEVMRQLAWLGAEVVIHAHVDHHLRPRGRAGRRPGQRDLQPALRRQRQRRAACRAGAKPGRGPRGDWFESRRARGRSCSPTCSISRRWSGCGASASPASRGCGSSSTRWTAPDRSCRCTAAGSVGGPSARRA